MCDVMFRNNLPNIATRLVVTKSEFFFQLKFFQSSNTMVGTYKTFFFNFAFIWRILWNCTKLWMKFQFYSKVKNKLNEWKEFSSFYFLLFYFLNLLMSAELQRVNYVLSVFSCQKRIWNTCVKKYFVNHSSH